MRTSLWILLLTLLLAPSLSRGMDDSSCLGCHGDRTAVGQDSRLFIDPAKFGGTTHAAVGCTSCHASVKESHPADGLRPTKASCESCHAEVAAEYTKSTHADHAGCSDCHNPHTVKNHEAVSGRDINAQCGSCHDYTKTASLHASWLPQTELHMDALPCITCHTGSENYEITLYLVTKENPPKGILSRLASAQELSRRAEDSPRRLVDPNGDGSVSVGELKRFNRGGSNRNLRIEGMLMPERMTHSFQTLDNRWDCTFCHASGAKAMQTSRFAIPQNDGKYEHLTVEKGAILDILYGTPDFYLLGATRNASLSTIGIAIIAAGLIMPVGHGLLRILTMRKRREEKR